MRYYAAAATKPAARAVRLRLLTNFPRAYKFLAMVDWAALYTYGTKMLPNIVPVLGAGAFLGLDEIITHYVPNVKPRLDKIPSPIRRRIETVLLMLTIVYAGFAAWQDEHNALGQALSAKAIADESSRGLQKELDQTRFKSGFYSQRHLPSDAVGIINAFMETHHSLNATAPIYASSSADNDSAELLNLLYVSFKTAKLNLVNLGIEAQGPGEVGIVIYVQTPNILSAAQIDMRELLAKLGYKSMVLGMDPVYPTTYIQPPNDFQLFVTRNEPAPD